MMTWSQERRARGPEINDGSPSHDRRQPRQVSEYQVYKENWTLGYKACFHLCKKLLQIFNYTSFPSKNIWELV